MSKDDQKNVRELFKNKDLLTHALTHRSWVNEHKNDRTSNERLEFLGDAILEFVVSTYIFHKFPDQEEGYLTALRANLVNTTSLSNVANKIGLGEMLFMSKGEEDGGGRKNKSILANTVEAIIGALFTDGGIEVTDKFINTYLLNNLDSILRKPLKDAKSRLQEHVQSEGLKAPTYKVIDEKGPDHNKTFTVEVLVDNNPWGRGIGKNKSEATQNAAENALEKNLVILAETK
jgi:ribonuclease-3